MLNKAILAMTMQNYPNDFDAAYYHRRCWQIYRGAPGLTCAAIARQLKIPTIEVQRYLGWRPNPDRTLTHGNRS